jgi:hypothetical protein
MTYLYVDYPYYKKFVIYTTMMSVRVFPLNSLVPVPLQLQCTLPQQELPVRNKDDSRSVVHNL